LYRKESNEAVISGMPDFDPYSLAIGKPLPVIGYGFLIVLNVEAVQQFRDLLCPQSNTLDGHLL
jgi:hypothetical protein